MKARGRWGRGSTAAWRLRCRQGNVRPLGGCAGLCVLIVLFLLFVLCDSVYFCLDFSAVSSHHAPRLSQSCGVAVPGVMMLGVAYRVPQAAEWAPASLGRRCRPAAWLGGPTIRTIRNPRCGVTGEVAERSVEGHLTAKHSGTPICGVCARVSVQAYDASLVHSRVHLYPTTRCMG